MLPTQQRLIASHLSGPYRLLHLVGEAELCAINRLAKIGRDDTAGAHGFVHARLIEADGLADRIFRPIHSEIRVI